MSEILLDRLRQGRGSNIALIDMELQKAINYIYIYLYDIVSSISLRTIIIVCF